MSMIKVVLDTSRKKRQRLSISFLVVLYNIVLTVAVIFRIIRPANPMRDCKQTTGSNYNTGSYKKGP